MEIKVTDSGRHPFEVLALLGSIVIGLASVFDILWPDQLSAKIPEAFDILWGIFFTLGSATALTGVRMKNRETGVLLEQIGLMILSASCWTLSAAMLLVAPAYYFPIVFLFSVLGVACLVQWVRIEVFVRGIISRGKNTNEGNGD